MNPTRFSMDGTILAMKDKVEELVRCALPTQSLVFLVTTAKAAPLEQSLQKMEWAASRAIRVFTSLHRAWKDVSPALQPKM